MESSSTEGCREAARVLVALVGAGTLVVGAVVLALEEARDGGLLAIDVVIGEGEEADDGSN